MGFDGWASIHPGWLSASPGHLSGHYQGRQSFSLPSVCAHYTHTPWCRSAFHLLPSPLFLQVVWALPPPNCARLWRMWLCSAQHQPASTRPSARVGSRTPSITAQRTTWRRSARSAPKVIGGLLSSHDDTLFECYRGEIDEVLKWFKYVWYVWREIWREIILEIDSFLSMFQVTESSLPQSNMRQWLYIGIVSSSHLNACIWLNLSVVTFSAWRHVFVRLAVWRKRIILQLQLSDSFELFAFTVFKPSTWIPER